FRAGPQTPIPIDLTTRAGLTEHLAVLDPTPQPGASLAGFLAEARAAGGPVEAILITHADVLADPDFQAALHVLEDEHLHVATVDRDGAFDLLTLSATGRRLVRAAQLNLDKLLAEPKSPTAANPAPLIRETAPGLPAIFGSIPFPML